jgi:hypothetical protein
MRRKLDSSNTVTLPTGVGGDTALLEADYTICVCDNDEGNLGCNDVSEFEMLSNKLTIISVPRLGLATGAMNLRAITLSSPTYRVFGTGTKGISVDDAVFARAGNCSQIPSSNTTAETSLLRTSAPNATTVSAVFKLPTTPQLTTVDANTTRTLVMCFVTKEGGISAEDVVLLNQTITIIPEPTGALVTTWELNDVFELAFSTPINNVGTSAGIQGDIIVLEPTDCSLSYTRDLATSFPITSGAKATLQENGIAKEYAIAQGKINELPSGIYRVCYATKTSEGDAQSDFRVLGKTIEIKPTLAVLPTLTTPDTVALGSDIVVQWSAGNGLDGVGAPAGSWLGLYQSNACISTDIQRHKCYLAMRSLPTNVTSGEVRFSKQEYKLGGDYEVRYFMGNTRHGQGMVCRGMTEISETFLQCMLETARRSSAIFVDADEPTALAGPGIETAGLEATFDNGAESFETTFSGMQDA